MALQDLGSVAHAPPPGAAGAQCVKLWHSRPAWTLGAGWPGTATAWEPRRHVAACALQRLSNSLCLGEAGVARAWVPQLSNS